MKRILTEKVPPPTYIKRDYPAALEMIVMRALEKRPEDRYQSAEDMRNELEEFLDEEGFRTGNRRMALYLKDLFSPEVAATDGAGNSGVSGADNVPGRQPQQLLSDDSEELNFDRRAPLAMRLQAAPTPAPTPAPSRSVSTRSVASATIAAPAPAANGNGNGMPGSAGGSHLLVTAAASSWSVGPAPATSPVSPASPPSPSVAPSPIAPGDSVELQLPRERKGGLLLLAAVLAIGLLVMVFTVLK